MTQKLIVSATTASLILSMLGDIAEAVTLTGPMTTNPITQLPNRQTLDVSGTHFTDPDDSDQIKSLSQ